MTLIMFNSNQWQNAAPLSDISLENQVTLTYALKVTQDQI